jgi:hypothetical protein
LFRTHRRAANQFDLEWYLYEARHWHDAVMHHKLMLDNLAPEERITVIALMREDEASEAKITREKP